MIGKSGTGGSFRGLANYIEQEHKLEWKESRNLPGFDRNQDIRLMEDTASMSRAEKPVYHLSVSYHPDDDPTKQQMLEDAENLLEHLGLDDHQAVIASHKDEDFKHVHLMVNRVHHNKDRAWNPWNDRQKYRAKLREIEAERGYTQLLEMERDKNGLSLTRGEYQRKVSTGEIEIPERTEVQAIFDRAEDWKQLEDELAELNLKIKPKGRGGVLQDINTGYQMKLSRVKREHSYGRLQKRFGKYKEYQAEKKRVAKVEKTLGKGADRKVAEALKNAHGWEDIRKWEKDGLRFRPSNGRLYVVNTNTGKEMSLSKINKSYTGEKLQSMIGDLGQYQKAINAVEGLDFYSDKMKAAFTKAVRAEFGSPDESADAGQALKKTMNKALSTGFKVRDSIRQIKSFSNAISSSNPATGVAKMALNIGKQITKQLEKGRGMGR